LKAGLEINRSFFEKKFSEVVDANLTSDKLIQDNIELKRTHTLHVCEEINNLSKLLNLSGRDSDLAYLIALFHDLGRFEQFARFKTFNDSVSVNHAIIAINTLKKSSFLDYIPTEWHNNLFTAILNHNLPEIKTQKDKCTDLFCKLIRDADKLDIWRIINDVELRKIVEGNPDEKIYEIPEKIYLRYKKHLFVPVEMAESVYDFRLVRAGWIFDINFNVTFRVIKERKLIGQILDTLPGSEILTEIKNIVQEYISEKSV